MATNKVILVGGGTRSGKSAFALALAQRLGSRRLYLASAQAGDDEMRQRIVRHQQERGEAFTTVEEPLAICHALRNHAHYDVVVFDCLTLWLANLLLQEHGTTANLAYASGWCAAESPTLTRSVSEDLPTLNRSVSEEILKHVEELTAVLAQRRQHVIVVTNEVGMGIVPETPLGRAFRDLAGLAHQRLSACADEVYLAVLGTVLRIKPACTCGQMGEVGP